MSGSSWQTFTLKNHSFIFSTKSLLFLAVIFQSGYTGKAESSPPSPPLLLQTFKSCSLMLKHVLFLFPFYAVFFFFKISKNTWALFIRVTNAKINYLIIDRKILSKCHWRSKRYSGCFEINTFAPYKFSAETRLLINLIQMTQLLSVFSRLYI